MDGKATDLHTVTAGDILDQRRFADNLDEFLAGVAVLVQVADVTRAHFLFERDTDRMLLDMRSVTF